jgi:hypothetical protein
MGRRCLPSVVLRRGSQEMLFGLVRCELDHLWRLYTFEDPADSGPLRRLVLYHRFADRAAKAL